MGNCHLRHVSISWHRSVSGVWPPGERLPHGTARRMPTQSLWTDESMCVYLSFSLFPNWQVNQLIINKFTLTVWGEKVTFLSNFLSYYKSVKKTKIKLILMTILCPCTRLAVESIRQAIICGDPSSLWNNVPWLQHLWRYSTVAQKLLLIHLLRTHNKFSPVWQI